MSHTPPTLTSVHDRVYDNLPWYVAGTLDELSAQETRVHLQECEICRDGYARETRIASHVRSSTNVDLAPQAAFTRLMSRIDAHEARRRRFAWIRSWFTAHPHRFLIATAAIQAAVIAVLVGMLLVLMPKTPGNVEYRTLTDEPGVPDGGESTLRAVFSDDLTTSGLRGLLNGFGATIVDGPGSNGVFTLALPASSDAEAAVRQLRAHPAVRFAEVVSTPP